MSLPERLIIIDKDLEAPVYLQIAEGFIGYIREGVLKPGAALPGSRSLAESLKVHRQTVIAAYRELDAQGWIGSIPRKGVFVAQTLPAPSPRPIQDMQEAIRPAGIPAKTYFEVDEDKVPFPELHTDAKNANLVFNDGFPDTRIVPIELLIREYRRFANYRFTSKFLMYGPEQGSENLRIELARFLSETRGLSVSPDSILITKGVQMALYLLAQVLLSKGDTAIACDPGYFGANEVFEQAGGELALVPVDEHGIDCHAVEEICKKKKVKLLYVIPHHHRPTTVTLHPGRRKQLLELAVKYRFAIIEDDYDYDFHYAGSPILPLASVDHYGTVIYVGSFCKMIAPGIRVGFMIAPKNLIVQATRLRKLIDRQGEQLLEEAMAHLLKNGDITRHLKKTNKIYHERRDRLCSLLKDRLGDWISFKTPDGGFAVWLEYLHGLMPREVAEKAAGLGLTLSDGSRYFHDPGHKHSFVRLGFASLDLEEMEQAVGILDKAIKKLTKKI